MKKTLRQAVKEESIEQLFLESIEERIILANGDINILAENAAEEEVSIYEALYRLAMYEGLTYRQHHAVALLIQAIIDKYEAQISLNNEKPF